MRIGPFATKVFIFLDAVPLASSLTNSISLIAKYIFSRTNSSASDPSSFKAHVMSKSVLNHFALIFFPFISNGYVIYCYFSGNKDSKNKQGFNDIENQITGMHPNNHVTRPYEFSFVLQDFMDCEKQISIDKQIHEKNEKIEKILNTCIDNFKLLVESIDSNSLLKPQELSSLIHQIEKNIPIDELDFKNRNNVKLVFLEYRKLIEALHFYKHQVSSLDKKQIMQQFDRISINSQKALAEEAKKAQELLSKYPVSEKYANEMFNEYIKIAESKFLLLKQHAETLETHLKLMEQLERANTVREMPLLSSISEIKDFCNSCVDGDAKQLVDKVKKYEEYLDLKSLPDFEEESPSFSNIASFVSFFSMEYKEQQKTRHVERYVCKNENSIKVMLYLRTYFSQTFENLKTRLAQCQGNPEEDLLNEAKILLGHYFRVSSLLRVPGMTIRTDEDSRKWNERPHYDEFDPTVYSTLLALSYCFKWHYTDNSYASSRTYSADLKLLNVIGQNVLQWSIIKKRAEEISNSQRVLIESHLRIIKRFEILPFEHLLKLMSKILKNMRWMSDETFKEIMDQSHKSLNTATSSFDDKYRLTKLEKGLRKYQEMAQLPSCHHESATPEIMSTRYSQVEEFIDLIKSCIKENKAVLE